jgi:hypothetical protein
VKSIALLFLVVLAGSDLLAFPLPADSPADSQLTSRYAFSAGMGVEYLNAPDVVDYVNAAAAGLGATQRLPDFKAGVQFFGAFAVPLSADWVLKVEYAYLLMSYTPEVIGPSDFTLVAHLPSAILQYAVLDENLYDLKVGAGVGYHFATLSTTYSTVDARFKGDGVGVIVDLEANTAFGESLFAYLGGDMRLEFIGALRSSPPQRLQPGLNTFSIGARFGFSYYF